MSTITIRQLLSNQQLRRDRGFNSLFAAYANTQRKRCSKCTRKHDMTTCRTLLRSLVVSRRALLEQEFDIPVVSTIAVYVSGKDLGIRVQ